jgi:three-Cys-motif partner protein
MAHGSFSATAVVASEDHRHRFGAEHTSEKLAVLRSYLPAYTTALGQRFTLHYIDAFAGTGECVIKIAGEELSVPGSASIAIECKPPFHKMVFIELSAARAEELERLRTTAPERDILVMQDDANVALPAYVETFRRRDRAVVFLDPYGMTVDWATLDKLAKSKRADVWYLFPLSGLYRQAAKDSAHLDASKEAALTRILGPHDWRRALYEPKPQKDLFGQDSDIRTADPQRMAQWVRACLQTIFPGVHGPKILYQMRDGQQRSPLFALFFLVSNPEPKALGLAARFAQSVLKP